MSVTVYERTTGPVCQPCKATKRTLDRLGVVYDSIPIESVPELAEGFKAEGLLSAPIVEVRRDGLVERWSGHRPTLLEGLAS